MDGLIDGVDRRMSRMDILAGHLLHFSSIYFPHCPTDRWATIFGRFGNPEVMSCGSTKIRCRPFSCVPMTSTRVNVGP